MKTAIVGGGLIGVTTLYELAARGEEAILLEAEDDLALGASFANGAMLTPSMSDPWNSPGVWRHLITSIFNASASMKLDLRQIPALGRWGTAFLRNSAAERHRATTLANFSLAAYSTTETARLTESLGLDIAASASGALKLFESHKAMTAPLQLAQLQAPFGLRFNRVDAAGAVALEPQLAPIANRIAGAIHYPDDRLGDARRFTQQLAAAARQLGAQTITGARILRIDRLANGSFELHWTGGSIKVDKVVLAAATATPRLAKTFGIYLPIKPAKGYSLTLELSSVTQRPRMMVIDDAMHVGATPLGAQMRLAGTAEFIGEDRRLDPRRVANLRGVFERLYPELAAQIDLDGKAWTGLRPMSADGRPFIGETKVPGLWINAGHGHLGWTKAVGSAMLLTDLMTGRTPAVNAAPFAVVGRFCPRA
jgi:D-amino-acid dehydrogenase